MEKFRQPVRTNVCRDFLSLGTPYPPSKRKTDPIISIIESDLFLFF